MIEEEKHCECQGIIFDLDGVICKTDIYHMKAWSEIADSLNIDFDEELNESLKGLDRKASLETLLRWGNFEISAEHKEELLTRKNQLYKMEIEKLGPEDLVAGVMDVLKEIKRRGLKMGIGSSSKNAVKILTKLEIINMFDGIVDGNKISKGKPDPEIFNKASQMLKLPPDKCLVVEDALTGLIAAHRAGMKCAVIGRCKGCENADYRLKDIRELMNIL